MKRLMSCLIGAWAFIAVAQAAESPSPPPAQETADQTANEARPRAAERKVDEAFCLRHTGSRIQARADRRTGKKDAGCIAAAGRVYTREDLDRVGEVDLADALRKLDPAIR